MRVKGNIAIRVTAGNVPAFASFRALGLSHADLMHVVGALEQSFAVKLPDARVEGFFENGTVIDLMDLVEGQVGGIA